ncbi:flagellar motor switch protein FliG [Oleiharenicola lentus]|jgi:flagellar motor switch protein FliG|uniref:Flagellar motor switch protein FliG n=1 Tax=Oleiharenicola lentus TaxID=2508720 RepID=A0A4Q1C3R2_9BACT|nr:flagellar motor switch protein FliG [Oleiharenicola lentus]RXK52971.1 flagellar motor switch protein FliG [Oleiharenicola lentus]
MADIDFSKLNRHQKLAVFLISIGPDTAAQILKQFDDIEIENLSREMAAFEMIPDNVVKQAMEEFSSVVASSVQAATGGIGFVQRTLELAKGDHRASAIVGRVGPAVGTSIEVIKDISDMEGRQIFNLIKNEQPQTISFVLSYLEPTKAAEVFPLLSPDLREEVIERLGTIESTSIELVNKIARSLGKHFDTKKRPAFHHSGGVRAVASLLNSLEKDLSKTLLGRLEERNASLSAAIRKKLFSFEDLNRLQSADLQRVLREIDSGNLGIALKSASEPLRNKVYAGLSKRAAESLKEEIEMLGPVRLKDVEAAQDLIIQAVRRLEEEGQITIDADSAAVIA